jgi:hypothetical protein
VSFNRIAAYECVQKSLSSVGRRLNLRRLSVLPVARYFTVVGSALTSLLLIVGWTLPEAPASFPDRPENIERPVIRITSGHKWPEKIVLDTSRPTVSPPPMEELPIQQLVEPPSGELAYQTTVDAVTEHPDARPIESRRRSARSRHRKTAPSNHMAPIRIRHEQVTLEAGNECCRSGWLDGPPTSKAGWRKRVARRDLWIDGHFPEAN